MELIFLGTPAFAVPTLERIIDAGHGVQAVFTQPDRPKGRGGQLNASPVKEAALRLGLPVHQPERIRRPEVIEQLRQMRFCLRRLNLTHGLNFRLVVSTGRI